MIETLLWIGSFMVAIFVLSFLLIVAIVFLAFISEKLQGLPAAWANMKARVKRGII